VFLDAREIEPGSELRADLCIVGAGAAGITLARELRGSGRSILLLESGGLEADSETHDLQRGSASGQGYSPLEDTRSRFFGGSTNCWAGYCRPLEAIDFESRDWLPHSGWPLTRADLDPYYSRANPILGLGEHGLEPRRWLGERVDGGEFAAVGLRDGVFQFGTGPQRMGVAFRGELEAAQNVRIVLRANVTRIQLSQPGGSVSGLTVRALGRAAFAVRARRYVLAAGGIENPRLLLASNDVQQAGVGNQHDLVGRFFMDHPHVRHQADLVAHTPSQLMRYARREVAGRSFRGLLQPRAEWLRATRSLSFGAQIRELSGHGVNRFMLRVATASRAVDDWPLPPRAEREEPRLYGLVVHHEQAPNPDSRVTLASGRDALGMRRAHLHWQLGALDLTSAVRAHALAARALGLARLGRARVHLDEASGWPADMVAGNHHMGTTRMHDTPKHGVVDAAGAVHGVPNLFIAGSSVFPTVGSANPTLTIVALALRLADHLRGLA
jgi:choline dehydrogenase-like flavoprotein